MKRDINIKMSLSKQQICINFRNKTPQKKNNLKYSIIRIKGARSSKKVQQRVMIQECDEGTCFGYIKGEKKTMNSILCIYKYIYYSLLLAININSYKANIVRVGVPYSHFPAKKWLREKAKSNKLRLLLVNSAKKGHSC